MITNQSQKGFGLIDGIVAVAVLAVVTVGLVHYSASVGELRRQADTKVQENSYRAFQSEIALGGVSPTQMGVNPLSAIKKNGVGPQSNESVVSAAGRNQSGSANVAAYGVAADDSTRSGSASLRITTSGASVPLPPAIPLSAPSFRLTGLIPESEFAPNLTNEILGNAGNPPGTVIRYTTDGSSPTNLSPIWSGTSSIPAYPLPATLKAAAFHSDPSYSSSPVITTSLSRALTMAYGRASGGSATAFLYSDVTGGTNGILLTINNAPPGTVVRYTYDGSPVTGASPIYSGAFHIPIGAWSGSVTLQAAAFTPASNITVSPVTATLTPLVVALPSPSYGAQSGSTTVIVPVTSAVPAAMIRYDIDTSISGGSPTTTSGSSISFTAP